MTASALLLALIAAAPGSNLADGVAALADFRPDEAVVFFERAFADGPYAHEDHVLLYEQLGVAYAYLERGDDARAAFRKLLALDPSRAISYTLSPKVTFLFEQARREAKNRGAPAVDLSWSRELTVDAPIRIDVEVLADPEAFLDRMTLRYRLRGASGWSETGLELPPAGESARVELPALAASERGPAAVELYAVARDADANEVLIWGSEPRPREVTLRYEPPDAWYTRWWVWVAVGAVVAGGATAATLVATRDRSLTVPGVFRVEP